MKKTHPTKSRRSHHKSRTGCVQCKQRKVKCDEQKPTCQRCEGYGTTCSFLQTHPKGAPPTKGPLPLDGPNNHHPPSQAPIPSTELHPSALLSQPLPANFTMLDLELLHFWVTESAADFGGFDACTTLFQTDIVQIAFEYDFLMHALLSLAAYHLSHIRPQKLSMYRYASDRHAAIGLSLSHPYILNLDSTNCHACFAFSLLTFSHAWASQDRSKPSTLFFTPSQADGDADTLQIKWVKLHRGTHSILGSILPVLQSGPLNIVLAPWKNLDPNRLNILQDEDRKRLDELSSAWDGSRMSEAQKVVLSTSVDTIRRVFSMMTYCDEVDKTSCVMAWFSRVSDEFLEMLEEKVPEALLVIAYLSVAMKRLGFLRKWWQDGMAENLLGTILNELGEGWERWTDWPVEQVFRRKGIQDNAGNIVAP